MMVVKSSYIRNDISYTDKTVLYWITQVASKTDSDFVWLTGYCYLGGRIAAICTFPVMRIYKKIGRYIFIFSQQF